MYDIIVKSKPRYEYVRLVIFCEGVEHMKEYKIIRIKMSKDFSDEETLMNKMSSEGWDVVSVAPDATTKLTVHILITFSRDK